MSEQEKEKSAIRPARVIATAMAAVTGAFFASQLGVYGTVVGVGLISLASTVGGELYLRSLDRTKEAAKAASDAALAKAAVVTFAQTTTTTEEQTVRFDLTTATATAAGTGAGAVTEVDAEQLTIDGVDGVNAALERVDDTQDLDVVPILDETRSLVGGEPAEVAGERRRIRWPLVTGATVAAFVLAMIVITGIEALTGNSFSGEKGSTVGQLAPNSNAEQPVERSNDQSGGDGEPGDPAPAPTEEGTPAPGGESGDVSDEPTEPSEPTEPPSEGETTPPAEGETEPPTDDDDGDGGDDGNGEEDGIVDDDAEDPTPRNPGA